MTKLKLVRLYKAEDVPEEIVQEVNDLVLEISETLSPVIGPHNANIVISALNRFHAMIICSVVTKDSIEDAAKTEVIGLIKNIEHISGQSFFDSMENHD